MLFDTHAHYDDRKFSEDRDETIERAYKNGVKYIINVSYDLKSSAESVSLSDKFDFVYAAVGIHPHDVAAVDDSAVSTLEDYALNNKKVVAIGEIGLDYYYDNSPRELQRYWFARQIRLAKKLGLPIIVHDRDAHEDTFNIVREEEAGEVGGVFHCHSGSVEMAKELIKNNFYIAIGGAVTFKNARKVVDVAAFVPDDRLLIETDCPYMTPEPFRGKRNESSYVRLVAEKIAEIRGVTAEYIARITTENAKKLFRIYTPD